nr:keratinocyte proline-rich protein-like [Symphalangus syndactylus]
MGPDSRPPASPDPSPSPHPSRCPDFCPNPPRPPEDPPSWPTDPADRCSPELTIRDSCWTCHCSCRRRHRRPCCRSRRPDSPRHGPFAHTVGCIFLRQYLHRDPTTFNGSTSHGWEGHSPEPA